MNLCILVQPDEHTVMVWVLNNGFFSPRQHAIHRQQFHPGPSDDVRRKGLLVFFGLRRWVLGDGPASVAGVVFCGF